MGKAKKAFLEGWGEAKSLWGDWDSNQDWLARSMLSGTFGSYISEKQKTHVRTNPHLRGFGAYVKTQLRKNNREITTGELEKLLSKHPD